MTARLPVGTDDADVVRRLGARRLAASALSTCYAGPTAAPGLLLGFGGSREPALTRATRLLGEVLRDAPHDSATPNPAKNSAKAGASTRESTPCV